MKIAVYTIAKDEYAHCDRWSDSCSDADYRVVADTGSTDGTQTKLRDSGVTVYDVVQDPWRFDHARNKALSLVPFDADICISLDMDEWLVPGWRSLVEQVWKDNTTRLNYRYVFDYQQGIKQTGFWVNKIHSRLGYTWKRPVHETVFCTDSNEIEVTLDANLILQKQDTTKSSRGSYMPLLAIAHEENPLDSQIAFWYARDLLNANDTEQCKLVLNRYLEMPTSQWGPERNEARRLLSYLEPIRAEYHLLHAITESANRRETWLALAKFYYDKNWVNCHWASVNGISTSATGTYLDNWNNQLSAELYDLAALACWNLSYNNAAISYARLACDNLPNDTRLANNLDIMRKIVQ